MAIKKTYLDYRGLVSYDNNLKTYFNTKISNVSSRLATTQASLGLPSESAPNHIATGVYRYIDDLNTSVSPKIESLRNAIGLNGAFTDSRITGSNVLNYIDRIKDDTNASILNISSHTASLEERLGWPSSVAGASRYGIYKELEDREEVIAATFAKFRDVIGLNVSIEAPRLNGTTILDYIDGKYSNINGSVLGAMTSITNLGSSLNDYIVGANNHFSVLDNSVNTNKTNIQNVSNTLGTLSTKVDNVSTQQSNTSTRLNDVSTRLNNVSTRFNTYKVSTDASITSLKNVDLDLSARIKNCSDNDVSIVNYINNIKTTTDTTITQLKTADTSLKNYVDAADNKINASILNISSHTASLEERLGWPSTEAGHNRYGIYKELEDREEVIAALFAKLTSKLGLDSEMEDSRLSNTNMLDYIDSKSLLVGPPTQMSAKATSTLNSANNNFCGKIDCIAYELDRKITALEEKINQVIDVSSDGIYFKAPSGKCVMALKDDGVHVKTIITDDTL